MNARCVCDAELTEKAVTHSTLGTQQHLLTLNAGLDR